jgi:hypothetical protein
MNGGPGALAPLMRIINRSAIIVEPKEPFLKWLHSIDPTSRELTLAELRDEPTVYLLPDCEDEKAVVAALKRTFRTIFEAELEGWYKDRAVWPTPLTFRRFQSWFSVRFHSMVADMCDFPLVHEEG